MEGQAQTIDLLLSSNQTIVLLLTGALGLITGRILRTMAKIAAYVIGFVALLLLALQYFGLIFVTVNVDFLSEIFRWAFYQARHIGVAEHLFFWVPMVYGLKRKRILGIL